MNHMFFNCESLKSLPDISLWNTYNVTNMSFMFYDCLNLERLPDISIWKICFMSTDFRFFNNLK